MRYGKKPLDVIPRRKKSMLSKLFESMNLGGATAASENVPGDIRDLIQKMTCVVPEERISAEEVVQIMNILASVC